MNEKAVSCQDFVASIGVNLHMAYTDGAYASEKHVSADLAYLGVGNIRDGLPNLTGGIPSANALTALEALAKSGIKEDLIIGNNETNLPQNLNELNALEKANPGSIKAIEGPNEINNAPVIYDGLTGQTAATKFQTDIYAMVKADSALNAASVFDFTGGTSIMATPYGTLTAQTDGSYRLTNGVTGWKVELPPGVTTFVVTYVGTPPWAGLFGYPGQAQQTKLTSGPNGTLTFTYDNTSGMVKQTYLTVSAWNQTTDITSASAISGGSGNLVDFHPSSSLTGLADYANIHPYPSNGNDPESYISSNYRVAYGTVTPGPSVITEDGYETDLNSPNGVTQLSQARGDIDILFDGYASGASQTYLYELLNEKPDPANTNSQFQFGLFNYDNSPKLAATAIHNMTSILADAGAISATFTPGTLAWSSTNLPVTANTLLLEKSNGAYDLAIWDENGLTNTVTTTVNLALGATYQTVKIFDVVTGAAAFSTQHNVSSVALSLGQDPLIVEIEPSPATINADAASVVKGVYTVGQIISFTLTASEAVIVKGVPMLKLNDGAVATYVAGSGSANLVFDYIVAAGQDTATLAVTGVVLPAGSSISDAAGTPADLTGAITSFTGLVIDTATAAVTIKAYDVNHNMPAAAVYDSESQLLVNLAGLQALRAAGKLASVTLLSSSAPVSALQASLLAALPRFSVATGASLVVEDTASNLLSVVSAKGVAVATAVSLIGTSNVVDIAQAAALAKMHGFSVVSGATLTIAGTAAKLLSVANAIGMASATAVDLVGTKNVVTAAQAQTLAGFHGFAVGAESRLTISDTNANTFAAANAAGLAQATSLVLSDISGGETVNLTGLKQTTSVNLGSDTASVSSGLSAPKLTFIGTSNEIILGLGASTIACTMAPSSGVEQIANFNYGLDQLKISINGVAPNLLHVADTTYNGIAAISIFNSTDPQHGLMLTGVSPTMTANDLLAHHLTFNLSKSVATVS